MRDNLIEQYGTKSSRPEIFGLLFVTCRLRDTPNTDHLVRNPSTEPKIDPEFLEKVSDVNCWVLLDKFWNEYPELVRGLDPKTVMISEEDLV
jgi:hypothetical protein